MKVYTGYDGTCRIEYGLFTCKVDNLLTTVRGLSVCTGGHTMLYL